MSSTETRQTRQTRQQDKQDNNKKNINFKKSENQKINKNNMCPSVLFVLYCSQKPGFVDYYEQELQLNSKEAKQDKILLKIAQNEKSYVSDIKLYRGSTDQDDSIRRWIARNLLEDGYCEAKQEGHINYYVITDKGRIRLMNKFDDYMRDKQAKQAQELELEKEKDNLITLQKGFFNFLNKNYMGEINEADRLGKKSIVIDFKKLSIFNHDVSEYLLDNPNEALKLLNSAIDNFNDLKNNPPIIRVNNIPDSEKKLIGDIRHPDIGKLIKVEGLVRFKSDVRPNVQQIQYSCNHCGNIVTIIQTGTTVKNPIRCGCGAKKSFYEVSKIYQDIQKLELEEPFDFIDKPNAAKINIILKGDLVSPLNEKKVQPGSRVVISGIVKETPIYTSRGISTTFDLYIEANYVENDKEDFYNLQITDEDKINIENISKKDPINLLCGSILPTLYLDHEIKHGLILQAVGGVRKINEGGSPIRGDIHILLFGDPGCAKSQICKKMSTTYPKSRYTTGGGITGTGLTASITKDDLTKTYCLNAGSLALCNNGCLVIDELDKSTKEDRDKLHEGLEDQTISIDKANIQATLKCQTTVLAAANPKYGRFDDEEPLPKQIGLAQTLVNRFDLIFPFIDKPNPQKDKLIAESVLGTHKCNIEVIPQDLLKKYFAYVRQNYSPTLTEAAINALKDYYVDLRAKADKGIPINARQLRTLSRLAEANAKLRLSQSAGIKDVEAAISVFNYFMSKLCKAEDGTLDIDRLIGIPNSARNDFKTIKSIILKIGQGKSNKKVPLEDLLIEATKEGFNEEKVIEIVNEMCGFGDIFKPDSRSVMMI